MKYIYFQIYVLVIFFVSLATVLPITEIYNPFKLKKKKGGERERVRESKKEKENDGDDEEEKRKRRRLS